MTFGLISNLFEAVLLRSKPKTAVLLKSVELGFTGESLDASVQLGTAWSGGNTLARKLVEGPPNVVNPTFLARCA